MAYGTYSWSKLSAPAPVVPLVPPIDPQHSQPSPDPNLPGGQLPVWQSTVIAPVYPDTGDDVATPVGGGIAVDHTPDSHDVGVGVGPGLTEQEASQISTVLGSRDYGGPAARQVQPLTDRYDGSGPHVAVVVDEPGNGDSPQSLELQRYGVGSPFDPGARRGQRIPRWWDRVIDMHWFTPQMRPITPRRAYTAPPQPPVPQGGPTVSPYPTSVTYNPGTLDQFVAPQDRRSPVAWDLPMTTDGTGAPVALGDYTLGL